MSTEQNDSTSQGMIDGIANSNGGEVVQQGCVEATSLIDKCIDHMVNSVLGLADEFMLSVLLRAEQQLNNIRANISARVARYLKRQGWLARDEQSDHLTLVLDDEVGNTMQQFQDHEPTRHDFTLCWYGAAFRRIAVTVCT